MIYAPGATSQSIDVAIYDDTGLPVTGLVAATFPAVYWSLAGNTAATAISLSDLALITSSYSSGGVKERAGSAGVYRLDLPNAALASAGAVKVYGDASGKHLVCEPIVVGYVQSNAMQINGVSAGSVTTVNANVGTTQPVNFTGTGSSAYAKSDVNTILGSSADGLQPIRTGTAQSGTSSTITLDASASSVNEFYRSRWIRTTGGTGAGQVALCTMYNGTTKAATIEPNWAVTPDNTTTFAVLGTGPVDVGTIDRTDATTMIGAVWDEMFAGHTFAGSFGLLINNMNANIITILGQTGTTGVVVNAGSKTGYELSATGLNAVLVDGVAMPTALAIVAASTAGKVSGAGTGTEVFKGLDGSTTRITVVVDSSGNRTSVTY